ncbi:helix-turn-helix domain-containing protein [Lachnospiraceae bacterium ZAX-1]
MSDYKISLAAARVNAGLTQEEIARKMEVNKSTILNWEKGKIIPKPAQFKMFCDIAKVPEDIIFLQKS